jgi:ectoine hydroxylase-related dioxygenase (phytanoyl-CoA dioxygenase family)
LVVYPGSHRLDRVYRESVGLAPVENDWTAFGDTVVERWRTMLTDGGFQLETYRPKAGTVLIWHENLMHAGSVRQDLTKSRKSIVCHYFAEGVVGYYDSSAMPGSMQLDERG